MVPPVDFKRAKPPERVGVHGVKYVAVTSRVAIGLQQPAPQLLILLKLGQVDVEHDALVDIAEAFPAKGRTEVLLADVLGG